MHNIRVEPECGAELDRLITSLLNATGAVHRTLEEVGRPPGVDGVQIVGLAAARMREILALLAEHHADAELAVVTQVLAEATLLISSELGLSHIYRPGWSAE